MTNPDSGSQPAEPPSTSKDVSHPGFWALTIGSVGVVYGDIGTSPIYAFREANRVASTGPGDTSAVIGILSLIFWSLIVVVTLNYVIILTRADNKGEGGNLALMALAQRAWPQPPGSSAVRCRPGQRSSWRAESGPSS